MSEPLTDTEWDIIINCLTAHGYENAVRLAQRARTSHPDQLEVTLGVLRDQPEASHQRVGLRGWRHIDRDRFERNLRAALAEESR